MPVHPHDRFGSSRTQSPNKLVGAAHPLDQPAPEAWPITGASFILVKARQEDAAKGREVLAFFDWAYKNGDGAAAQLDYLPMPAAVKDMVRKSWTKVTGPDGKPVYR